MTAPAVHVRWAGRRDVQVTIDGHDITRALTGINIAIDAHGFPVVTASLSGEVTADLAGAAITLPDDVHAALTAAGWTPPATPPATP